MSTPEYASSVATTEIEFRKALDAVYENIAVAAERVGRDPREIRVLPVSKNLSEERMRAAHAAGMTAFGDNKVQEAEGKAKAMSDLPAHWAVGGPVQAHITRSVAAIGD